MSGRAATENVIPGQFAIAVGDANMPCPPGWSWRLLTDVARLESGHTPSRKHPEWWGGSIPWIGIKDARPHHGRTIYETVETTNEEGLANSAARLLPAGTVCLSRTASVGYVVVMGRDMATSQDFVNWVCSETVVPDFLKFLFIAEKESLLRFSKGTTHSTIYFPEVKALRVCLPPPKQQKRIVAKIEALQARSEAAEEALDAIPPLLEKFRRSVLAAAFRGDLTREWREANPHVESASKLLERIREERRRRWEKANPGRRYSEAEDDDGLREGLPDLPPTWRWTSVDAVGDVLLGRQRAPQYLTGRYSRPYLRVANIKDDRIDFGDLAEMDFDEEHFKKYRLQTGDILVSEGQSLDRVGQSAIYDGRIDGLCFQKTLHRFRPLPNEGPSSEFAQAVFRGWVHLGVFRRRASITTNIAHLTLDRFKRTPFPLPPKSEQEVIAKRVMRLLDVALGVEQRLRERYADLATLQQSILAKAFRGELVPQVPNDEPASKHLDRIQQARATDQRSSRRREPVAAR
ncbi:MAG: hypothetical protein AMXMBFR64_39590 [Myxococcales bacterium]